MSGLTEWARREGIEGAHLTAIGAFSSARFGWFDKDRRAYRDISIDQQVECISLIGDVGLVGDKPAVHVHGCVGLSNGLVKGGHLIDAVTWPTLEVFVSETAVPLHKHKDDETVPLADSLGAFDQLVKAGKIRAIGLSQFTAPRLREAMETAAAHGLEKPCCLQTWYNLVEREKLEGELRDAALAYGLGIFPFYSLANGFLTGKYRNKEDLDKSPRGLRNIAYLEGKGLRVVEALDSVAAEAGAALATVALAWTMAQPGITAALASATSLDQLRELQRYEPMISAVRGRGLFLAFDLPDGETREKFWKGLFDLGVLTLRSGERSIRFRPALDITAQVVDEAMGLIRQYCRKRK